MSWHKTQTIDYLAESDLVSLSVYLRPIRGRLEDLSTAASHQLHPKAEIFLRWLRVPRPMSVVYIFAKQARLKPENVREIFDFMNSIAGITIQRKWSGRIGVFQRKLRLLFYRINLPYIARRYPNTLSGIVAATFTPFMVLVLAGLGVTTMGYILLERPAGSFVSCVWFLAVIWGSLIMHEMTHATFVRKSQPYSVVVVRGLRIGILHRAMSWKLELTSALSGAFIGGLTALLMGFSATMLTSQNQWLASASVVAVFHLISLLPLSGDGLTLLNLYRSRYAHK